MRLLKLESAMSVIGLGLNSIIGGPLVFSVDEPKYKINTFSHKI